MDNVSSCIPGNSVCEYSKPNQNRSDVICKRNPFSKSLSLKKSSTPKHALHFKARPDVADHGHVPDKSDAAIERQSSIAKKKTFNLKIRKRAQCPSVTSSQKFEIKKPCSNLTKLCGKHLPPNVSPISSPTDLHGTLNNTSLLGCDDAMLKSYYGHSNKHSPNPVCILDLDNIDERRSMDGHAACVSTPKERYSQSRCKIPLFPTFSPRKRTPSSSPFILKGPDSSVRNSAMGKNSSNTPSLFSSPSLYSSPSLFPTPSQHLDSSATSSMGRGRKSPKRVLFPQNTTECRSDSLTKPPFSNIKTNSGNQTSPFTDIKTNSRNQEEEDFFFGVDVSFSELLSHSGCEVSFQSPSIKGLNRYLVLEVVTQSSTDISDNGRSDFFLLLS